MNSSHTPLTTNRNSSIFSKSHRFEVITVNPAIWQSPQLSGKITPMAVPPVLTAVRLPQP
jgi:hypothetical protein